MLVPPQIAGAAALPAAADAFVESVGVCTHLESPPYNGRFDEVAGLLARLGVRHLRDELRPTNDLARWRALHERAGIRSHLLVSPATNTVAEMLDAISALGAGSVSAVEGQNEGDSDWFRAQPSARRGWAEAVVGYQREVFAALRARFSREALPVVSPSVLDYAPDDMRLLRPAAPFCDIVALHAYAQGRQEPETPDAYAGLGWYLRAFRDAFKPGAPAMVTEAGYFTARGGVPAAVAAKYAPRLLLHAFSLGIVRTFLYELMDEGDAGDPEQNYGLLTASAAAKPAFDAVRRLLTALADRGPGFVAAPLRFELRDGPPDVRALPLQKRGGEVVFALWRARRSWDARARRAIEVAPAPVRLMLSRRFAAASQRGLDDDGPWAPLPAASDAIDVIVRDTVMLLRLTP